MDNDNSDEPKTVDETEEIQNLCMEAESHAEALVGPLKRTVEELDKLYHSVNNDSETGTKVEKLCNEIDGLISQLKEMVGATRLEIEEVTKIADVEEKVDDVCEAKKEK